ncbi:MAG: PTS sugar transporter subunit IIA [Kurthia sp.]|nr:PTS sugar transporter subunit IIA [Candidatus Kurthia equi]
MLENLLSPDRIRREMKAETWEQAIELAGQPLLADGSIENSYIQAIIRQVNTLGPYIILTPNVALPHARPEDGVNKTSMSLLSLATPCLFPTGKTVQLLFFLAAADNESHLFALQDLAEILSVPENIEELISCEDEQSLQETIYKQIGGINHD